MSRNDCELVQLADELVAEHGASACYRVQMLLHDALLRADTRMAEVLQLLHTYVAAASLGLTISLH